jgi:hypothetical protein
VVDLDLRCSTLTHDLGERPAGTAGSWHRVILVELPLPWPKSIEDHPMLAGVEAQAPDGRRHRIQALASALTPEEATPDEGFRVICYWRAIGAPFARFERAEICAPEQVVAEMVSHLIEADDATLAATPADSFAAGPAAIDHPVRDLLVCTHGTRDRCCGKLGTELFRSLGDTVPPGVRLWRTSHTGGHRFAPTGLTFPDGGTWAGLDGKLALGLIDRTIAAGVAAEHARGSAGAPAGPAQVADAAGLAEVGWAWSDQERHFSVETEGDRTTIWIATAGSSYRAVVEAGRDIPVPDCGNPLDAARKSTIEWDLVSFDQE